MSILLFVGLAPCAGPQWWDQRMTSRVKHGPTCRRRLGHPGGQRNARQRGIIEVNLRVETPRPPGMATIPKLPGRRQPGFPPRHATPLTAGAVLIQPPSVGTLPPAARPGGRRRGLVGGAAWASRFQPASRFGGRPVQAGVGGPACRPDGGALGLARTSRSGGRPVPDGCRVGVGVRHPFFSRGPVGAVPTPAPRNPCRSIVNPFCNQGGFWNFSPWPSPGIGSRR